MKESRPDDWLAHRTGGGMYGLRILMVGFDAADGQALVDRLRGNWHGVEWASASIDQLINDDIQPNIYDLILIRESPAIFADEFKTVFLARPDRSYRVIVILSHWDEVFASRLLNSGVDRVISAANLGTVLPDSIQFYFPPGFNSSMAQVKEPDSKVGYHLAGSDRMNRPLEIDDTLERMYAIFNALAVIVTVRDIQGRIIFINRHAEMVSGYSLSELRGKHIQDFLLLPEERDRVMDVFARLKEKDFPNYNQNSWLCRDGSVRKIDWCNTYLDLPTEGIEFFIGIGIEVTSNHYDLKTIKESEEKYARIFQENAVGLAVLTFPEGKILDVNGSLARLLNLDRKSLIGESFTKLGIFHADEFKEHENSMAFLAEQPVMFQRKFLVRPDEVIQIGVTLNAFSFGGQIFALMTVEDFQKFTQFEETIRRSTEDLEENLLRQTWELEAINRELKSEISFRKAIESSSQRLTQIIWETPDIVAISDLVGRVQYLNKTGRRMFGLNEVEPVNHLTVYSAYSTETNRKIIEEITPLVEKEGVWHGEMELVLPDQRIIPVSQVIIAHRNADGKIEFFSSIARDISDQRRASIELQTAYKKELELNRLRTNFFSMTSHQFRTPLSTILSSVELLTHYGSGWPEEKRLVHMRRIQDATNELTVLLNDVLELSRIEARKDELHIEPINLPLIVEKQVQRLAQVDDNRHLFDIQADGVGQFISSDRVAIERVVENLISNAVKFSPEGSMIRIKVGCRDDGAYLEIVDQGIGIPEDDQELLFQPFHRGGNVVDTPGSGIGLMIVQKSLELIQGEITIESQEGKGTAVKVRLPGLQPGGEIPA